MVTLNLATVVTKTHLREFLFLKTSAEHFHKCKWHVICDAFSFDYLKDMFSNVTLIKEDILSGSVFGSKTEQDEFFKTVCKKFEVCRQGLKNNQYVLFLDSDIVFTGPMCSLFYNFINSSNDIVVSPHYQLNDELDNIWGKFNVGFVLIKNEKVIDDWEAVTLTKKYMFEQKPLEVVLQTGNYKFDTFPITYNMGWWRFNNDLTKNRLLSLDIQRGLISYSGVVINSFHVHMLLDEKNTQNQQSKIVKDILLQVFKISPLYHKLGEEYERLSELSI